MSALCCSTIAELVQRLADGESDKLRQFKVAFTGQLKPPPPNEPFVFAVQRGPFQSAWLRVAAPCSDEAAFATLLDALEAVFRRAVYVCMAEAHVDGGNRSVTALRKRQYVFHHYDSVHNAFVYYKWLSKTIADRVPGYATAIEGAMTLPMSRDRKRVLLVHERGHFKPPGGAVDLGEHALTTARRELFEETGLALDETEPVVYVGGLSQAKARDNLVNDRFSVFVGIVKNVKALQLDEVEISKAQWFDVDFLLDLEAQATASVGANTAANNFTDPKAPANAFSLLTLRALRNFVDGKYLRCIVEKHAQYQHDRVYFI